MMQYQLKVLNGHVIASIEKFGYIYVFKIYSRLVIYHINQRQPVVGSFNKANILNQCYHVLLVLMIYYNNYVHYTCMYICSCLLLL